MWSDAWICCKHARDVGVDLAHIGIKCSGQCNGSGVATAATERGEFARRGYALETSDHNNFAFSKGCLHAVVLDFENFGFCVYIIRDDAHLVTRKADSIHADASEGHRQKSHGDALARGEQHVHFTAGVHGRNSIGQREQVVSGLSHGRNHHNHVVSVLSGERHMIGHRLNAVGISYGRTAIFLNNQCHRFKRLAVCH